MKVGIVGAGAVGATAAYAMVLQGSAHEIILVDQNEKLAAAQAHDITDATPFAYSTQITSGNYDDLAGAQIVVLAAGIAQRPGDTRLDLLKRNADVFGQIIPRVLAAVPQAILLVATNPVDVMTDIAARIAKLPPGRVFGSGTILDSARFRNLLSQHIPVNPKSIHAYVLGEHGDSEVLWWSGVTVGGVVLDDVAAHLGAHLGEPIKSTIDESVRRAADRIIAGKGATWFGIGGGISRLVQAVGRGENLLVSVSAATESVEGIEHVTLSLPRIVGKNGIEGTLMPKLDAHEKRLLRQSAEILKEAANNVGL